MMYFTRRHLRLYAITDGSQNLIEKVKAALAGGVTLLQLRNKTLKGEALLREVLQFRAICDRYNVPLIVNDDLEAALDGWADGVHLGQEDLSVAQARRIAPQGSGFIIGATAKTVEQARQAQAQGADYIGVGAIFPSPTKPDAIPVTMAQLREICAAVTIPAVAIGGINGDNMDELMGSGVAGVAVSSALFGAPDVGTAARALRARAEELF